MAKTFKNKLILLIALAVVAGVVFFACIFCQLYLRRSNSFLIIEPDKSHAQNIFFSRGFDKKLYCFNNDFSQCAVAFDGIKPWDIRINLSYDEKNILYVLSENLDGLDSNQLKKRRIYTSATAKFEWLQQIQSEGIPLYLSVCYILPNFKQAIEQIISDVDCLPVDATTTFCPDKKEKFVFTKEQNGRQTDVNLLCERLCGKLNQGEFLIDLEVPVKTLLPATTLLAAKNATSLKSDFKTGCVSSTLNRQNNIALALSFFNGKIVAAGETVSFNQTVGARTKKRGFSDAKILVGGKYVDGVGGGVCQASTTLFNALLYADLRINSVCQHSVKSGYVLPCFDAMVNSGSADLVFTNNSNNPIYFAASCKNGVARVQIYGQPNKYEVRLKSVTKEVIPFKTILIIDKEGKYEDKVEYSNQQYILQHGVDGVKSEGYLEYYSDGKLVSSRLFRKNQYATIDRLIVIGAKHQQKMPQNISFLLSKRCQYASANMSIANYDVWVQKNIKKYNFLV